MKNKNFNLFNLFKVLFVWSAIIIGIVGAAIHINWLIIIAILMFGATAIYVRYYTMKERLDKRKG